MGISRKESVNMSKSKMNIPLRAAGILFCLTLISTCFTSGFYARYISRNTGDDYTSVAQFNDLTILESGSFEWYSLITSG